MRKLIAILFVLASLKTYASSTDELRERFVKAACDGDSLFVSLVLKDPSFDPTQPAKSGITALLCAVDNKRWPIVVKIIDHAPSRIDLFVKDKNGVSLILLLPKMPPEVWDAVKRYNTPNKIDFSKLIKWQRHELFEEEQKAQSGFSIGRIANVDQLDLKGDYYGLIFHALRAKAEKSFYDLISAPQADLTYPGTSLWLNLLTEGLRVIYPREKDPIASRMYQALIAKAVEKGLGTSFYEREFGRAKETIFNFVCRISPHDYVKEVLVTLRAHDFPSPYLLRTTEDVVELCEYYKGYEHIAQELIRLNGMTKSCMDYHNSVTYLKDVSPPQAKPKCFPTFHFKGKYYDRSAGFPKPYEVARSKSCNETSCVEVESNLVDGKQTAYKPGLHLRGDSTNISLPFQGARFEAVSLTPTNRTLFIFSHYKDSLIRIYEFIPASRTLVFIREIDTNPMDGFAMVNGLIFYNLKSDSASTFVMKLEETTPGKFIRKIKLSSPFHGVANSDSSNTFSEVFHEVEWRSGKPVLNVFQHSKLFWVYETIESNPYCDETQLESLDITPLLQ